VAGGTLPCSCHSLGRAGAGIDLIPYLCPGLGGELKALILALSLIFCVTLGRRFTLSGLFSHM
jgi:hypothetical protein